MRLLTFFEWQEHTIPQKQSTGGVLQNIVFKNLFTRKHLCQSLFFNKVVGASFFIEKKALAQVFSFELCETLRTRFLIEHLRRLLLYILQNCKTS